MILRLFKTKKTFPLSRYFSIVSLVTIILAALILSWMYRVVAVGDLTQQGESHNIILTQTFSNAIWSQVKFFVENQPQGRRAQENQLHFKTLHDSIQKLISNTPVLKIKIFSLNRRTVYSSQQDQVGEIMPENYPGSLATQKGQAITQLNFHNSIFTVRGVLNNRYVLSSYLPVRDPANNEIQAVFEIYADVTELYNDIIESRNDFALVVISILGFVYMALFLLVRHADGIIRNQAREREKYLDEIKSINKNLDRNAKELALAHDKAVEASTSKSQFLANMSHELRTPLNAVIGYSEMLAEDMDSKKQKRAIEDLGKIQDAGKHLLTLINEILDISKIEAGRILLHLEDFDVYDAISSVATTIQPLAKKGKNSFEVICDNRIGLMHSDLTRFRQILFNLLSNACKFTKEGKITLQATRHGTDEAEHINFVVQDSGIGISTDKLERIFEPFQQADSSTTREHGGTGLGLTISKRFCEMLGGSIHVESEPNIGTRFIVKLPTKTLAEVTPDRPRPRLPDPPVVSTEKRLLSPNERRKKTSRVLLIDDDPVACELHHRFLKKNGFAVIVAHNGQEGIKLARIEKPDLITLDVMMPGKNGWDVLQELKQDPLLKDIPVIMVSIVSEENMGYELGAADFLTKPINWQRFGDTVRKWIRIK